MTSKKNIWEKIHIDLGERLEKTKIKFSFKARVHPDIERIKIGCKSCTKVLGYNPEKMTLDVEYSVGEIPFHLRRKLTYHNSRKVIQVFYKDKTNEILTFTAKIKKR